MSSQKLTFPAIRYKCTSEAVGRRLCCRVYRTSFPMATLAVTFFALLLTVFVSGDYPKQRRNDRPQSSAAVLVPYPRVGKRFDYIAAAYPYNSDDNSQSSSAFRTQVDDDLARDKRLIVARVGKRFLYAARIG